MLQHLQSYKIHEFIIRFEKLLLKKPDINNFFTYTSIYFSNVWKKDKKPNKPTYKKLFDDFIDLQQDLEQYKQELTKLVSCDEINQIDTIIMFNRYNYTFN